MRRRPFDASSRTAFASGAASGGPAGILPSPYMSATNAMYLLPAISAARLIDDSVTPSQFGAISSSGRGPLTFVVLHQCAAAGDAAGLIFDLFDCHVCPPHDYRNDLADRAGVLLCEIQPAVRHRLAMQRAPLAGVGMSYSPSSVPSGAMWPILFAKFSVHQRCAVRAHRDAAQRSVRCWEFVLIESAVAVETAKRVCAGLDEPDRAIRMGHHRARLAVGSRESGIQSPRRRR